MNSRDESNPNEPTNRRIEIKERNLITKPQFIDRPVQTPHCKISNDYNTPDLTNCQE